jgi:hypothetical protein
VVGPGLRLFEDVEEHVPLDVVQSAIFGSGVVNVTYAPANADEAAPHPPVVGFPEPVIRDESATGSANLWSDPERCRSSALRRGEVLGRALAACGHTQASFGISAGLLRRDRRSTAPSKATKSAYLQDVFNGNDASNYAGIVVYRREPRDSNPRPPA